MKTNKLLIKLLKFNTENSDDQDNGNTKEILQFIKKLLEPYAEIQSYEKNKGNLIAFLPNPKNLPIIGLQGHLDTVPIGKTIIQQKDETIYGRGSVDMKGSIAVMINAFIELSKKELEFSPALILTSDEEANNFKGIKKFIEKNNKSFKLIINGEPSNLVLKNKFKGAMYYKIYIQGKSGHGSRPHEGINAIEIANKVLKKLIKFKKQIIKKSTLNIGTIKGGDKVNKIPSECTIEFEMRPIIKTEKIHKKLKKLFKNITLEKIFAYDPHYLKNIPEIKKLKYILKKNNLPIKEGTMDGFSEATFLNKVKIPTIILGAGDSKYSHSDNEQINEEDLETYHKILTSFFLKNFINFETNKKHYETQSRS